MTYKDKDDQFPEEQFPEPKPKKQKKYTKGFYVVLTICLIAVGAAAWTTYGSVTDYVKPSDKSQSSNSEEQAGVPISGVTEETSITQAETEKATAATQPKTEPTTQTQTAAQQTEPTTADAKQTISIGEKQIEAKDYVYPVGETIYKDYSADTPTFNKTLNDWRVHQGTDFKAESGTTVKLMDGGVVKDIYNDDLLGVCVSIEHLGGFEAVYCGIQPNDTLEKGQNMAAGDVIGVVSKVPFESMDDSHLHLEVKVDEKLVDPMEILKAQ